MIIPEITTQSEAESIQLAEDIALAVRAGDLILLSGQLGSGKTVFSRGLIRHLAGDADLEVPSPTYLICLDYECDPPVVHYDLYRLSSIDELDELGWQEGLPTSVTIMEWPENCFDTIPQEAVRISISQTGVGDRTFSFDGNADFLERIARSLKIRAFLDIAGYQGCRREFLLGDASTRSYEVINDGEMVLMNSPEMPDGPPIRDGKPYSQIAHLAENVSAFVGVGNILRDHRVMAPKVFAQDLDEGFLLTEHFGSTGIIDQHQGPITERYLAAIELLAFMHGQRFEREVEVATGVMHTVPDYDADAMMIEVELLAEWYVPHESSGETDIGKFQDIWCDLITTISDFPTTLVMRDFHSPNILWLDKNEGTDRVGVIDFQDAMMGPEAYDVASLAQDARIDVSSALEEQLVGHYVSLRCAQSPNFDAELFHKGYAIMAAQRATKILGIFVRLDVRDGKPQYRAHLPRMREYLKRSLRHPVLSEYKKWLSTVIEL